MAGELELIEVSLLSGESNQQTLTFTPGTPANHVGIGTGGQWVVLAEGVLPVHLYLVFDGRSVHVAAGASNARVLLAGAPVGTDWVKAAIPCELRFGGACLIMRHVPRPRPVADEDATMHDGGALWQAAQRVSHSPPLAPEYPAARPAAGAPAGPRATVPDEDPPTPMLVAGPDAHRPHVRTLPPTFMAAPAPPAAEPRPRRDETTSPPLTRRSPIEDFKHFWSESSLAKKATLVLMPLALVASYQLLLADAPEPPSRTTPTSDTDKPVAPAQGSGARAALTAVTTDSVDAGSVTQGAEIDAQPTAPPPKVPPLAPGKRTPERQALDTAAAGSFDDASRLYAALAAAHPDDPTYKEAARILREKTGHDDHVDPTRRGTP